MTDPRSTDVVPTLPQWAEVVNVGLGLFGEAVVAQGHPLAVVDWRIPAGGDMDLVAALGRLYGRRSAAIDAANAEVLRRLDEATPQLVAVAPARDVIPGLGDRMLLHCGPPIAYGDACDPLRRSLRAAVVAEGWAAGVDEADRLLAGEEVLLDAASGHDTVVPMVTALGPSQPVWVAENPAGGNRPSRRSTRGPARRRGSAGRPQRPSSACASSPAASVRSSLKRSRGTVRSTSSAWPRRACRWATTSTSACRPAPTCSCATCCPTSWPRRTPPAWRSPASCRATTSSSSRRRWPGPER